MDKLKMRGANKNHSLTITRIVRNFYL